VDRDRTFPIRYSPRLYWIFWPLLLGTRHSEVRLTATTLSVRMGWAFDARIPRSAIRYAGRWRDWPWAIGVHGNLRGSWLVNGSATGLVQLVIDPPARGRTAFVGLTIRWLGLGLRDPDGFLGALDAPPPPEGTGPGDPGGA
jgi:hypothetical protein